MKAYLSSTFEDLVEYRTKASHTMRGLGLQVVAMEDYGGTDKRPVDRCLEDVENCDLYVGVFAFRYGYVPEDDNPERRSITEMEYRHAIEKGIPVRVFIVPDKSKWQLEFHDAVSGEGEHGKAIGKLRAELRRAHSPARFETVSQLGEEVAKSVGNWMHAQKAVPTARPSTPTPLASHPRRILSDLMLLHAPADADNAAAIAERMSSAWKVKLSNTGLTAASVDELKDLEASIVSARASAVLLSAASLTSMAEDRVRSSRALGLARDRTGLLFGLAIGDVLASETEDLGLTRLVGPSNTAVELAVALHEALLKSVVRSEIPEIGLPVVTVAMTAGEAAKLLDAPPPEVAALLDLGLVSAGDLVSRYGDVRTGWRPFSGIDATIEEILAAAVARVNGDTHRLRGQAIRLQHYPLDRLGSDSLQMWPIYAGIARNLCLVVVDELSLFSPNVRRVFENSPFPNGEQVAFVSLSPLDPSATQPHELMRRNLDTFLRHATERFSEAFDPLYEIGIPERRRFDRWLHGSLPRAVETLRDPKQDPNTLRELADEVGTEASADMARLIAGERRAP